MNRASPTRRRLRAKARATATRACPGLEIHTSNGVFFFNNNSNVWVADNTIQDTGGSAVSFNDNNSDIWVTDNTNQDTVFDAVLFDGDNTNVRITDNAIRGTGGTGVVFVTNNTNVLVSGNTFTDIGDGDATDHVFDFLAGGNTLLPGSTGNVVTNAVNAGDLCNGTGNFAGGPLEVTDQNGNLFVFETVDPCS